MERMPTVQPQEKETLRSGLNKTAIEPVKGMPTMPPQEKETLPPVAERPVPSPKPAYMKPWRALTMGACGVVLLCAVTPYNDYRINNTPLYSNHLPLRGLVLLSV